jgi:hypothetical protein
MEQEVVEDLEQLEQQQLQQDFFLQDHFQVE